MPELPEVETTRRHIAPYLIDHEIKNVQIYKGAERLAITHTTSEMVTELIGRRIVNLDRHGKYLLFLLDDDRTWIVHLRMTGALIISNSASSKEKYERARITLDNNKFLIFDDMRKFGTWHIVKNIMNAMPGIGPDAYSSEFTVQWLVEKFSQRKIAVKTALLDQKIVAGIGNIYADEACFDARINPQKPSKDLSLHKVKLLYASILKLLDRALDNGGTTFSNYRDGFGRAGNNSINAQVFRRDGFECYRCREIIVKIKLGGRGTHYCPSCQK